jgi:hypothetical protein
VDFTDEQERLITGEAYKSASTEMKLLEEDIKVQVNKGFGSAKECANWAHDHLLDIVMYHQASSNFMYVSHFGKTLTVSAFEKLYKSILFNWYSPDEDTKPTKKYWIPDDYECVRNAKVNAEQADGVYKPLYHRNYYLPTGYYDKAKGSFNTAIPIPTFAKPAIHRDTSHIYTYIENIAGECAPYLLAWLRTKLLNIHQKTEVTPIFISRTQGTGKTTFAEVICKGLFGKENVIVTDKYSRKERFNADVANALVICKEETDYTDKRNNEAEAKNDATASSVRFEKKGQDPYYQESYTEFILTSNRDVPLKFEGPEDQRRFMIMQVNEDFTRNNLLADEVFTKLYGYDKNKTFVSTPFVDDKELQAQFIHELIYNKQLMDINIKDFPRTEATQTAKTMARTNEATDIESIMRSIAPFIKLSLDQGTLVNQITIDGEQLFLTSFISTLNSLQYMPATDKTPAYIAICRPLVFNDPYTNKAFPHALVERCLYDSNGWLQKDFGLKIENNMEPLRFGFRGLNTRYRHAAAARVILTKDSRRIQTGNVGFMRENTIVSETVKRDPAPPHTPEIVLNKDPNRPKRFRVNERFQPADYGIFETTNPMKVGTTSLTDKNANVASMDFFLFESDDVSPQIAKIEHDRLNDCKIHGNAKIHARDLYAERLALQTNELNRLCNEGLIYRAVNSGNKSIHMLVRVKDPPSTLEEYTFLHALIGRELSDVLDFDPACSDPAHLTRSPVSKQRISYVDGVHVSGLQTNIYLNEHSLVDIDWRPLFEQWKNRPKDPWERRHKLLPGKSIYKEAMQALLEGTFFTDPQWNGQRQNVFFPAYRLLRVNYDHSEIWSSDGILCDLNGYYKQNEVNYWRTRENSHLIKQIDEEMDIYNDS